MAHHIIWTVTLYCLGLHSFKPSIVLDHASCDIRCFCYRTGWFELIGDKFVYKISFFLKNLKWVFGSYDYTSYTSVTFGLLLPHKQTGCLVVSCVTRATKDLQGDCRQRGHLEEDGCITLLVIVEPNVKECMIYFDGEFGDMFHN